MEAAEREREEEKGWGGGEETRGFLVLFLLFSLLFFWFIDSVQMGGRTAPCLDPHSMTCGVSFNVD